ncbi:MAG: phospholipase D-like domain-containing protein [Candidatus Rifleibacteriota bacterium]
MKKFLSITVLLTIVLLSAQTAFADVRADYERYISSYNAYRNAILENKSEAEVKSLHSAYLKAKSAYEKETGRSSDEVLDGTDRATGTSGHGESDFDYSDAAGDGNATVTQRIAQIPVGLRRILTQLWSEKGRKNPDAMMRLLAAFIENNPRSDYVDMARYELAKAYDLLKNDKKSSTVVLKEIIKNRPDSKLANIANQRLSYYSASVNAENWKKALNSSYLSAQNVYKKYRDTAWLAFPVKTTRWVGYVKKLYNFNQNQKKYVNFQLAYEKLGARFIPPVNVTFDRFKPATGYASGTADVRLVYNNNDAWYARWKLLQEARHSIDIQYFIVDKDIFGMSMLGALLKKAKEGVKIRLMLDSRGTKQLTRKLMGQDLLQELTEMPNCKVKVFNPVHTNLLTGLMDIRKIMASNHDKIFIVDKEFAMVGGRNISKDYFVGPVDHPEGYRDCDVVIRDAEVARQLDFAFDEEFAKLKTFPISEELWGNIDVMTAELNAAYDAMYSHILNEKLRVSPNVKKDYLNSAKEYLIELSPYKNMRDFSGFRLMSNSVEAPAKIIDKHSLGGPRDDITDEMVKYIDGCRKEVLIQNPYVVLTDRIFAALQRAGRRDVSVKIHTNSPYSTDSLATQAMFYADWKKALSEIPNCHIYVYYGKRKLHAKNWVFDGKIGIVGTYNLDYMSEQINSEVVAAVKSGEFAGELRNEIYKDINDSKEYKVSIDDEGKIDAVFGPDDVKGKNFWLLKTLSKFTIFKKLI